MKAKKKSMLGPGGLKGFFLEHIEKIVLVGVLLLVIGFVFSGSKVEKFDETKTPATLVTNIQQASDVLDSTKTKTWVKVKDKLVPPPIDNLIVISTASDEFPMAIMNDRLLPSRTKRRDPALYPPMRLEVETAVAAVAFVPNEEEMSKLDEALRKMEASRLTPIEPLTPEPVKKKKKTTRPGQVEPIEPLPVNTVKMPRILDEEEREAILKLSGNMRQTASNMAIAHSRNIVALKALIPWKKQLDEYKDALEGNPQYVNEERDIPTYVFFKVERADVTADPSADPKTLKWTLLSTKAARDLPYAKNAEWDNIPEELVDPAAVIPETDRFGALTLPVPPALLTDMKKLAGHSEIPWASTLNGPDGVAQGGKKKKAEEGPDTEEAPSEGPESPEGPEAGKTKKGSVEGPNSVRPSRGGSGYPVGPRGGRGGPRGERGGGYGGEVLQDTTYKLFRFIDFNVERGRQYRYRVSVMLEDPNHPQVVAGNFAPGVAASRDGVVGNDPHPSSLDKTVETRLRDLKKKEDESGKRVWFRETEFSEASPIAIVPDPLKFVGGSTTAPRDAPVLNTRIDIGEAGGKALVVSWDTELAVNVVGEEEVQRGTVLNFVKDAETLHPIKLEYVELPDYSFRTDALVVDIRGGAKLPGGDRTNPLLSPGEMAMVDHQGRLVVLDEARDLMDWQRFAKIEPKKLEEVKIDPSEAGGAVYGEDLVPRRGRTPRTRE